MGSFLGDFARDIRWSVRVMLRSPGLYLLAILSLGLGIGVNTTVFSATDAFIWHPLPYLDGVYSLRLASGTRDTTGEARFAAFAAWERSATHTTLAAEASAGFNIGTDRPEYVHAARVSQGFFRLLRSAPALGRAPDSTASGGGEREVVISTGLWRRRLGGTSEVLGRTLSLDGEPFTIVGVMGADFAFPTSNTDVWLPIGVNASANQPDLPVRVFARLAGGATVRTAEHELTSILDAAGTEATGAGAPAVVQLRMYWDELITDQLHRAATIISFAVAFVLLIACANVANLLLAKGLGREREILIRQALGASRGRIIQQFITESLTLGLGGGAVGALATLWGVRALVTLVSSVPNTRPFPTHIPVNGQMFTIAFGFSVLSAVLIGLAPAAHATGFRIGERGTLSRAGRRLSRLIVAGEIALVTVLLIASSLLIKGFVRAQSAPLGFRLDNVVTFQLHFPAEARWTDTAAAASALGDLETRLRAVRGILDVGSTSTLPLEGFGPTRPYAIAGTAVSDPPPAVAVRTVTPGYAATLGLELIAGRLLDQTDDARAAPVVMINQAMVRRRWGTVSPIGSVISMSGRNYRVVGVVADTHEWGPGSPLLPLVYASAPQEPARSLNVLMRTQGSLQAILPAVRRAVQAMDSRLAVDDIRTMREVLEANTLRNAVMARLMTVFAVAALLMALVGVFGTTAYAVAQRTSEIGIRMALGARAGDIRRMVLLEGLRLGAAGIAVGIIVSLSASHLLAHFLPDVAPYDVAVFTAVAGAFSGAVVLACVVPSSRAAAIDPMLTIRAE